MAVSIKAAHHGSLIELLRCLVSFTSVDSDLAAFGWCRKLGSTWSPFIGLILPSGTCGGRVAVLRCLHRQGKELILLVWRVSGWIVKLSLHLVSLTCGFRERLSQIFYFKIIGMGRDKIVVKSCRGRATANFTIRISWK